MKHRTTDYDFSIEPLPVSPGELSRALRNNKTYTGQLYEFLKPYLYNTPGVRAGKYWFTLVNVSCLHTGFSYGLADTPPKNVCPLSCTWVFTFALRSYGYTTNTKVKIIKRVGQSTIWGKTGSEFLTIGVTHSEAREMNLKYDSFTPEWLYTLVGASTKNFVLHNRFYTKDYTPLYAPKKLSMLYTQYNMQSLYNIVRNVPYHLWIFNRNVWQNAALISEQHITDKSLMYMCLYIRRIEGLSPSVIESIVDRFHESLTDFIQRSANNEQATDLWQLLYCALANRGDIPDDYEQWLKSKESELKIPSGNFKSHILNLL
jgi:hypothetical protein